MPFSIRIDDAPPASGFDIGELILIDPVSGRRSSAQPNKRCYMVYVELSALLDQVLFAKTKNQIGAYKIPGGSEVKVDGKKNNVVLSFPDLVLTQSLNATLQDLREVMLLGLETLSREADPNDVMIQQLRDGIDSFAAS